MPEAAPTLGLGPNSCTETGGPPTPRPDGAHASTSKCSTSASELTRHWATAPPMSSNGYTSKPPPRAVLQYQATPLTKRCRVLKLRSGKELSSSICHTHSTKCEKRIRATCPEHGC